MAKPLYSNFRIITAISWVSENLGVSRYCSVKASGPYVIDLNAQTLTTVKLLNIQTPEKVAVIALKFEQSGFTIE